MEYLSRKEEIILLSVWRLGENAYGMAIRDQLSEVTGRKWLFGSIYTPLETLMEKGFLSSEKGEPTAERGGRAKVYYKLTEEGKNSLIVLKKMNASLWMNVPPLQAD